MSQAKTGILLANLGTPEAPTSDAVKRYLRQFLSDTRVVDFPRLLWWPLLRGVILPIRSPRVAKLYQSVWMEEGSPLMVYSRRQQQALAAAQPALAQLGIDVHTDALHVTVRAVPLPLRQQNLQILIPELIGYLAQQNAFDVGNIAQWMARNLTSEQTSWNMAQAIALLADVERLCPQLVRTPPGGLLQPVDLHSAMNALKDE